MTDTLVHPSEQSASKRLLNDILRSREIAIALVLVAVIAAATAKNPSFLFSANGWRDLWLTPSILVLVAIGQAVVIDTRNVDLSVGSILGMSAYLTGTLFVDHPGIPIIVVMLAGTALGLLLGLINGALVAFGRVPALVITLGTMYIYRGIVLTWAGSNRINASDMPKEFLNLGTKSLLTIPILTIIAVLALIAVGYYLSTARGGREMYAIGSDPDAADLYGLRVNRRIITAFALCGALSGLAGVLYAARYGTVSSSAGYGWELQAVGAAVIGGVAIFGGSGTVWGAAIGAMLLLTIVLDRWLSTRQERKLLEARDEE